MDTRSASEVQSNNGVIQLTLLVSFMQLYEGVNKVYVYSWRNLTLNLLLIFLFLNYFPSAGSTYVMNNGFNNSYIRTLNIARRENY